MDRLTDFLNDTRRDVDGRLDELIPASVTAPERLHQAIRWSIFAGGKRFRPAILIAIGEALAAERSALLGTAAAVEMIHTYSLIHDDLPAMDNDDLRRGKATCHIQFGEATAILAGDVLQTLAFKAVADDRELSVDTRIALVALLADASGTPRGMVSGQQLDLNAEGKDLSIAEIAGIHAKKTGALITASAVGGALIASATDKQIEIVRSFGEKLGLLFQITDDLLDVTQETATLGKTAGKDVSARKATYPAHFGHERTAEMAETVRSEAISVLSDIGCDNEILKGLVDFVVRRNS
jgi:geranylgeranyl pyrophosphate synthase